MLTQLLTGLGSVRQVIVQQARRNIGLSAVVAQKTDPIQQLFVDKIRDYSSKSKSAGGKLVDATPNVEASFKEELEKVDRMYGAAGKDMTQFPTFSFSDPDLEAVGLGGVSDLAAKTVSETIIETTDTENKPYFEY